MYKSYEILSKTSDGKLVVVASTSARNEIEAYEQPANFCNMMDIAVHSVREVA